MKVFISYGFPEGRWHSKALIQALIAAGYKITDSQDQADIIIAHSGGCHMLHPKLKARLILLVGLAILKDKSLITATRQKVSLENKNIDWYKKSFFNIFYLLTQPVRWLKMREAFKLHKLPSDTNAKIILIRNNQDTYASEKESQALASREGWIYKSFSGQHDDLWENPETYIDLINSHIKITTLLGTAKKL